MSCKLYANLQQQIYNLQRWNALGEGIWISEMQSKQAGWKKPRRIIVIKQEEEVRSKATGKKLKTLFDQAGIDLNSSTYL